MVMDFRLQSSGFTKWSRWLLEATQSPCVCKHTNLIHVLLH